jgi:ADP-ribose pyrophosphatase YjhB (NUDIX family)
MGDECLHRVRVTGVLVASGRILVVRQRVSSRRMWSLPGGAVQEGETLEAALVREMREETGLEVAVGGLLYVCEMPEGHPPLLHVSFRVSSVGGILGLPSNELDANPISEVRMVAVSELTEYGFSERFQNIVREGFPGAGCYKGPKAAIGLD